VIKSLFLLNKLHQVRGRRISGKLLLESKGKYGYVKTPPRSDKKRRYPLIFLDIEKRGGLIRQQK